MKLCELCGKETKALLVRNSPDKSEWYCGDCNKSYLFTPQEAEKLKLDYAIMDKKKGRA